VIDKVNSGQGTIGQLLVNQQLYDNLNGATREMHLLMQDFRAIPRSFCASSCRSFDERARFRILA
jgi:phospholipid/cholesterol/gamma-HCH transport system substrate-binding protein